MLVFGTDGACCVCLYVYPDGYLGCDGTVLAGTGWLIVLLSIAFIPRVVYSVGLLVGGMRFGRRLRRSEILVPQSPCGERQGLGTKKVCILGYGTTKEGSAATFVPLLDSEFRVCALLDPGSSGASSHRASTSQS